jgi:hypothetical protein
MVEKKPICKDKHVSTNSYSEQSEVRRCAVLLPLLSNFTLQYNVWKVQEIQGGFDLSGRQQRRIYMYVTSMSKHITTTKKNSVRL